MWPGTKTGRGRHKYGLVMTGSRQDGSRRARLTHVVMWTALHGPVPQGKELHHRCMTELCCNPSHLQPVTHQENGLLVRPETKKWREDNMREIQKLRWT